MRNHNKLLGRVEGVDGIKTGYTRASGFNLVSSVRRGNRHIVAVVLGGASGGVRDARMRTLIEQQIAGASTQRTVAKIEESKEIASAQPTIQARAAEPIGQTQAQPQPQVPHARFARADAMGPIANLVTPAEAAPAPMASPASAESQTAAALAAAALSRQPKPGSGEPINPVKVKTITVKAGNVQTAMLVPLTSPAPQATVAPPHFAKHAVAEPAPAAAPRAVEPPPAAAAQPASYELAAAAYAPVTTGSMAARFPHPRGAWMIQVGAFPTETEAQERLREAQMLARQFVAHAEPFTERVTRGNQELFRARFAGFDQDGAEAACRYFKRNDIACMAIRN